MAPALVLAKLGIEDGDLSTIVRDDLALGDLLHSLFAAVLVKACNQGR